MSAELKSRARSAWGAFHRYNRQLYDRATAIVSLELKVKLLRSEVIRVLLHLDTSPGGRVRLPAHATPPSTTTMHRLPQKEPDGPNPFVPVSPRENWVRVY